MPKFGKLAIYAYLCIDIMYVLAKWQNVDFAEPTML